MSAENNEDFELESRLRVLLPETYEVFDEEVQPRSMGSAGLKYGPDGKVAWNEIWGSFCDLAMAGGPPHRGKLLGPVEDTKTELEQAALQQASDEICRGISLVTGLFAEASPNPGWIQMYCTSAAMTGWLMRAIVMENVSAEGRGLTLYLPTGAAFRLEKEIKNVITAVAKTCHYWQDHMSSTKHEQIATLLATMDREGPLVRPGMSRNVPPAANAVHFNQIAEDIREGTGLGVSDGDDTNWLGLECGNIPAAIWMMRALVVSNVLSRREGTVVLIPVSPEGSEAAGQSVRAVIRAHRLAQSHQVLA